MQGRRCAGCGLAVRHAPTKSAQDRSLAWCSRCIIAMRDTRRLRTSAPKVLLSTLPEAEREALLSFRERRAAAGLPLFGGPSNT